MVYLIEELDVDTGIDWWDGNRRKLNSVIKMFNEWQTIHKFDEFEKEVVLAKINAVRKWGCGYNSFSDWELDLLNEMENYIEGLDINKK